MVEISFKSKVINHETKNKKTMKINNNKKGNEKMLKSCTGWVIFRNKKTMKSKMKI